MESKTSANSNTNGNATSTADNDKLEQIRVQVEYYLSDENLKRDKFFHEKISTDANGYLDIDLLLNCNKLKNLNVTKDMVVDALKKSKELELSCDRVRRVGNKSLPELKFLNKKTKRAEEDEEDKEADKEAEQSFDPVILLVTSDKEPEFKWKAIQDKFKELNPDLNVVYLRFNKDQGHIGIYKSPKTELDFVKTFEIDGVNFKVEKCEGDALIDFWKDHGSHFEMCVGRNKKQDKKGKKDKKKVTDNTFLKNSVTLGDETFTDLAKIKSRTRRILTSTKDGEKVPSPDHEFLLDILKFHRNFDEKAKNLSFFTTGKPKEHDYSRCFFIVREDGSQEDFSVHKCIERLGHENKKKAK